MYAHPSTRSKESRRDTLSIGNARALRFWSELACLIVALASAAAGQTTTLVSVSSTGAQGCGYCVFPAISGNGRCIAFNTSILDLVPEGPDGLLVHDRDTQQTELVSRASSANGAAALGIGGSLSFDGRFVAFASASNNLSPQDPNQRSDIYVRDRLLDVTELISKNPMTGQVGNADSQPWTSISDDGRYVAFTSAATNLVPGLTDNNGTLDVFVYDRQLQSMALVSQSSSGTIGNGECGTPSISGDGHHVGFASRASNLVSVDANATWDVFVRDLQTNTTTRVSTSATGQEANGASGDGQPSLAGVSLSYDGRYVAFDTLATDLVTPDTNGLPDVLRKDRQTGQLIRVAVSPTGAQPNGYSFIENSALSANGGVVCFTSWATNLIAGGTSGLQLVFVRDIPSGQTSLASMSSTGEQPNDFCSSGTGISNDGNAVTFASAANNLVPGDNPTTTCFSTDDDVFVHDRNLPPPVNYCTAGVTTNGCNAHMFGIGAADATAPWGFWLIAANVEGQKQGLIFYGISGRLAAAWTAGSTSFLCVKTPVQRTPVQSSGGTLDTCNGTLAVDWNSFVSTHPAALGQPFSAGQVLDAQAWFRDSSAAGMTNLSDGLEFTVGP